MKVTPVILCGGSGTRLWPLSRSGFPKQFIALSGEQSLFQQAVQRVQDLSKDGFDVGTALIVTNEEHRFLALDQLKDMPEVSAHLILEPTARNTAPALSLAALEALAQGEDSVMVVSPADHAVQHLDVFQSQLAQAVRVAQSGGIVTLGITPTKPETGYGYIKAAPTRHDHGQRQVERFVEKPNLETAQQYLDSGAYFWNSGIFIWSTKSILAALEKHDPELSNVFKEGVDFYNTFEEANFISSAYATCKNISIDYSVMEKAENVYVRSSIFGWSDLGTWGSLYTHIMKDNSKNALVGKNIITYDCNNCIVQVPKEKLVVLQGLEDYIVVENDGILMICKKQDEQQIRNFVNDVKVSKGEKFV